MIPGPSSPPEPGGDPPAGYPPAGSPPGGYPPVGYPPAGYPPIAYWPVLMLAPPPPRVWPAIVVPILAVAAALVASTVAIVIAAASELGLAGMGNEQRLMEWVQSYGATPLGFLVLTLPGQLIFFAAALAAAWLSPIPLRRRLGLNGPSIPWWGLLLLVAATPFAGMCGDLLVSNLFRERGEHLEMLTNLLGGRSGLALVLVTLVISLAPGFSEEMLFRGYTQGRLLKRWHPAAAIGLSSLFFAAAHVDPAHVAGVLPLGIWLGVMAWLCGSIWPAILCHITNNATAVLLINLDPALASEPVQLRAFDVTVFGVSALCLGLSVWVMLRYRKTPEPEEPSAPTLPDLPPPIPWNTTPAGPPPGV